MEQSNKTIASADARARRWVLTRPALVTLLSRLNPDEEQAARDYERLRGKLIVFFLARRWPNAEDCADETLDRVCRRIEEGEPVRDVGRFAYGVARLLLAEVRKAQRRRTDLLSRVAVEQRLAVAAAGHEETYTSPVALECLRACAAQLSTEERHVLAFYYQGGGRDQQQRRKELAADLHISVSTLRLRAFRIRRVLERCTRDCLRRREMSGRRPPAHE